MHRRVATLIGISLATALLASACAVASSATFSLTSTLDRLTSVASDEYAAAVEASTPRSTLPEGFPVWSASATGQVVVAHAAPDATSQVVATYAPVNIFGYDPTTFAVFEEARDAQGQAWYRAQLPPNGLEAHPNGTQAWIPAIGLDVRGHNQKLLIDLSDHSLALLENGTPVQQWSVGIGKPGTATPTGNFFVWTKWLPDQGSHPAYGNGVLAISAQSVDLPSWQGGAPLIGIHGTSRQSDLGADVSHGCVRMWNESIQQLLDTLPLGTPVDIVA